MGRRLKYSNDNDRQAAIRQSKSNYMLNKESICPVCNRDYSLAGKWSHLKTNQRPFGLSRVSFQYFCVI